MTGDYDKDIEEEIERCAQEIDTDSELLMAIWLHSRPVQSPGRYPLLFQALTGVRAIPTRLHTAEGTPLVAIPKWVAYSAPILN